MAINGTAAIFRVTNPGDNEDNVADKIDFNLGVVPDATGKLVTSNWHGREDLSVHPNPNKPQNIIQVGELGGIEVVLAGYFRDPANTLGKQRLFDWIREGKDNDDFEFGRFGLRVNDLDEVDMIPSATQGYILYDVFVERRENSPNEVGFIAKFWRNGTTV
ncbi:hypothetical protein KAR91_03455 [Candidatus Pacearchaeota archaeon]|nr:hypothetical protein [Candidatus Pacearchaeota archaeon]